MTTKEIRQIQKEGTLHNTVEAIISFLEGGVVEEKKVAKKK